MSHLITQSASQASHWRCDGGDLAERICLKDLTRPCLCRLKQSSPSSAERTDLAGAAALVRLPRQRNDDPLEIKPTKLSQAQPNSQRATWRGRLSGARGGPSASADLSVEPTTKVNQLFSGILLSSAGLQLKQSDWRDLQPEGEDD